MASSRGKDPKQTARDGYSRCPERRDSMKKLSLSKETLRTLDDEELTLVVGGAANSGQFNPAKCPSSGHPNCG
jgi:hypothetical protein